MSNLVALPSGTELAGDFRIKRVLGAGGFGITYLADELALARQVTIKEYFPTDYAARKNEIAAYPRSKDCAADYKWGLDRFIEEAQTLARFDHPNIVRVFRYFRANNTGYMVLKFEEGGSFKAWLRGLGRAPRQAELDALLGPILDALEFIHKEEFLHRDIAPDNIMVRKDKTPVLIDFGSARGEIVAQTRTVSALVKPGYSPYEQYASTSRQQGPWTDIYALAATFYQAICGKRPPDAPSRMVKDEYVSARDLAIGSYRAGFLAAIDKALRLEVTERPQSVAEWRTTLLAPDPKPAAGKSPRARIGDVLGLKRDPEPDIPAPAQTIAIAASPAAAGVAAAAEPVRQATLAKSLATARLPADPHVGGYAPSVNDEPRFGLGYGAPPVEPNADMVRALPAPALVELRALPPPLTPAPALTPVVPPRLPQSPAKVVAATQRAETSIILPPALPQPIERRKPRRQRRAYFFLRSPWRGLILKFAAGLTVATLFTMYQDHLPRDAATPTTKSALVPSSSKADPRIDQAAVVQPSAQQLVGPTGSVKALQFAAESRRVVTIGTDASLRVWDAVSGAQVHKLALTEGAATALAVQDNKALTGHADGTLVLWDLDRGERLAAFKRGTDALTTVAFAPEADHLIAASRNGSLAVWSRKSPASPLLVSESNSAGAISLKRVSARDAVAYAMPDKTIRLASSEGLSPIRSYRGHNATITAIDSPDDGRALASASADGQIRLWSTASSKLVRSFQAHNGPVTALSYAPSGDTLASIGVDGILKIWDTKRGRLLAATPQRTAGVHTLAFAADGRRLATAEQNGSVKLWDAGNLRLARE
jgi:tRNA A-37 threonylcarbamoyl transferase component Bud32